MSRIEHVRAWEVLDSRGRPTVACSVHLVSGAAAAAAVPSGASTGAHEAVELRDGGDRYGGLGVAKSVASVNDEIAAAVTGLDVADLERFDRMLRELDGTPALARLGANAVLAVSVAAALARANERCVDLYTLLDGEGPPLLPLPMVNVLSGGAHAGGAIDMQDFLAVPLGASSFAEAIHWCASIREAAAELLSQRGIDSSLAADEGGLGPKLPSNRAALELLADALLAAGLEPGVDVGIAIDVAATQLVDAEGSYVLPSEGRRLRARDLLDELEIWCADYPVVSVEDPLAEDDWDGWAVAGERLGDRVQLLGDDLFVTQRARVEKGLAVGAANAVLVKPNQVGTLTDAAATLDFARRSGLATVVSARSGETEDAWLADLAVGWRAGQIKVGSTTRSERTAKWNRLLRIEAERPDAVFAGREALARASARSVR